MLVESVEAILRFSTHFEPLPPSLFSSQVTWTTWFNAFLVEKAEKVCIQKKLDRKLNKADKLRASSRIPKKNPK